MWFGIAGAQKIDLVELQILILGRVERDAVVDGQGDVAVLEERHQIVQVLERAAAGGDHHRLDAGWPSSRSAPSRCRRELAILRICTPSSAHRSTEASSKGVAMVTHPALRTPRPARRSPRSDQACRQGLLDVADVVAVAEILVDEVLHVAQLQLDRGADVVEAHDARVGRDDVEAALARRPQWLLASSSTNRSSKMSRFICTSRATWRGRGWLADSLP